MSSGLGCCLWLNPYYMDMTRVYDIGGSLHNVGMPSRTDIDRMKVPSHNALQQKKSSFNVNLSGGIYGAAANFITGVAGKMIDGLKGKKDQKRALEQWKATNRYNSPAQQAARLRAAGINPKLANIQANQAQTPTFVPSQMGLGEIAQQATGSFGNFLSSLQGAGLTARQSEQTATQTEQMVQQFPLLQQQLDFQNKATQAQSGLTDAQTKSALAVLKTLEPTAWAQLNNLLTQNEVSLAQLRQLGISNEQAEQLLPLVVYGQKLQNDNLKKQGVNIDANTAYTREQQKDMIETRDGRQMSAYGSSIFGMAMYINEHMSPDEAQRFVKKMVDVSYMGLDAAKDRAQPIFDTIGSALSSGWSYLTGKSKELSADAKAKVATLKKQLATGAGKGVYAAMLANPTTSWLSVYLYKLGVYGDF